MDKVEYILKLKLYRNRFHKEEFNSMHIQSMHRTRRYTALANVYKIQLENRTKNIELLVVRSYKLLCNK